MLLHLFFSFWFHYALRRTLEHIQVPSNWLNALSNHIRFFCCLASLSSLSRFLYTVIGLNHNTPGSKLPDATYEPFKTMYQCCWYATLILVTWNQIKISFIQIMLSICFAVFCDDMPIFGLWKNCLVNVDKPRPSLCCNNMKKTSMSIREWSLKVLISRYTAVLQSLESIRMW